MSQSCSGRNDHKNRTAPAVQATYPASRRVANLAHFLRQAALRYPEDIGLISGDQSWTWKELDQRIQALSAGMANAGVVKGDRVIVISGNSPYLFESMFACFRLGAVWVPTNIRQTSDEIAQLARDSGACIMICESKYAEHATAAMHAAREIRLTLAIGSLDFGESIDALIDAHMGVEVPMAAVEYDDACWFFYTSGTTGKAKAAVLTHGQMTFVVTNQLCDLMPGMSHDRDASLAVAPLSHGAGIHLLAQVARAVKTVLLPDQRLDPELVWQLVERWRITNMFTVPVIVKRLVEHPAVNRYDRSSLRHVIYAGAPMYREDQKQALRTLGKVLVQYFGLGEVTGNITVLTADLHELEDNAAARVGTCGYERTGMQVSIQDENGRALPAGSPGEICVCGPAVFAGYYNDPEANANAFRDGWFRTGDLGYLDEQGFLFITGRASDMYISGGSNIYPREIEEKLLAHDAVADVTVLGVPDRAWGEAGVAVVILRTGRQLCEAELLEWMGGRIARYKMPKRIYFWESLPRSAYGKVAKRLVREQLESEGFLTTL
jgi:fatty-acyl-CoA synthase